MAQFLRDEIITNLTVDSATLTQLFEIFASRAYLMPEYEPPKENQPPSGMLFCTIRFDQKGYRIFEVADLLNYFENSNEVERVIFDLHSAESIRSNGSIGSYTTLRLDAKDNSTCFLTVVSDDEEWVNCTFSAVKDVLNRNKNRSYIFRNPYVDILLQILGLVVGFFISLWGASIIAPKLQIDNAFLVSFILVLLVFSNLWGPLRFKLQSILSSGFPAIKFYRPNKDKSHWLMQALVGGVAVAVVLYLLSWVFSYIGSVLGVFID